MSGPAVVHGRKTDETIVKWRHQIVEFLNDVFDTSHQVIDQAIDRRHGNAAYWVLITSEQRILALCTIGLDEENKLGFVYNFSVHKYQRRRHLGTMLVHNIKSIFPNYDFYGLVDHENQDAIQFYNKMGAKRSDLLVNIDGTMYEEYRFDSQLSLVK